MVDFVNVYDEYAVIHRNGPVSIMYSNPFEPYSRLARGWFPDSSQAYQWPKQVMPPSNASIMSVYLIAVARSSEATTLAYLQYSTEGNQDYQPTNYTDFNVMTSDHYDEYLINVTWAENWTASMLLSPELYVRMIGLGQSAEYPMYVDYIGLRYNWTFTGAPPSGPISDWKNSTLGKITFGQMLVGGIGVIGFVGMILVPPVGIILARTAENKMLLLVGMTIWMVLCFGLFMAGVS